MNPAAYLQYEDLLLERAAWLSFAGMAVVVAVGLFLAWRRK